MIRFLSCGFRLLEIDDEVARASLSDAFERVVGHAPDFGPLGDAATGFHVASDDPRERQVVISRRANKQAARRAITLLRIRHRLSSVRVVPRPTLVAKVTDDWEPDLIEHPYDLDGVSVWPAAATTLPRDMLVLEACDGPGTFVSATLRTTSTLKDALAFQEAKAAWSCASVAPGDARWRVVWRAAALAALDQREAAGRQSD